MKKVTQIKNQAILDDRIHQTIKKCCAVSSTPIKLKVASWAFDFLSKNASPTEIERHKSEYILLFSRMVFSLNKETEAYTPKIVELTDWFFSKLRRTDPVYRSRLKNIVRMMNEKGMPVPQEKKDAWAARLEPLRRRGQPRPILEHPEPCACVLFGPQKQRIIVKD